jgi:leucyl-tRNA synthetase
MHIGHWYNYSGADFRARLKRMQGYNVLSPIGFDAFGLPAEDAAIKRGIAPAKWTFSNIENMKKQLRSVGAMFDLSREVVTADPDYYKWTQWFFLFMYKNGLAYKKKVTANWCPSCATVLANEQVVAGKCERCDTEVIQKELEQWLFKITDYAEELLNGLDEIDWPEKTKTMQRNWIGKSEGAEVKFEAKDTTGKKHDLWVFTTRPDTLFGATFMVLAPEHPLVKKITTKEHEAEVQKYLTATLKKTELQRQEDEKSKTGVFTGAYAINPANGEEIPIWISDYVLMTYGHGAIMAVPAHDQRDYDFAKKFRLDIKPVIEGGGVEKEPFLEDGKHINSAYLDGLNTAEAIKKVVEVLKDKAKKSTTYRLRDWLISRQRYWGAPIPMLYCEKCGEVPVPEKDLPVVLPEEVEFKPTGESPLKSDSSFVNTTCPKCGGKAKRETDTMDTFVCSSWYYFRYTDPKNDKEFASKKELETWLPVNMYVGGAEHSVLHLLYSRFFTKALRDHGYVSFNEPFMTLRHQGMILGPNGLKMSKSKGNVVSPDEWVEKVGSDTVRMYLGFMGPYDQGGPWNPSSVMGVKRFLEKAWSLYQGKIEDTEADLEEVRLVNQTLKKVGEDIENFRFNTAISALMVLVNQMAKNKVQHRRSLELLALMLAPFAPFVTEEIWQNLGFKESIHLEPWPTYDEKYLESDLATIVVQVNGKVRANLEMSKDSTQEEAEKEARENPNVKKYLDGVEVKKVIFVPNKLLNFVV